MLYVHYILSFLRKRSNQWLSILALRCMVCTSVTTHHNSSSKHWALSHTRVQTLILSVWIEHNSFMLFLLLECFSLLAIQILPFLKVTEKSPTSNFIPPRAWPALFSMVITNYIAIQIKSKIQYLSHTNHISSSQEPHVASGCCANQHRRNISITVQSSVKQCGPKPWPHSKVSSHPLDCF